MLEQANAPLCVGLLAHVDAGKTTLSEALLYCAGARRTLGRVDHGDAFLDSDALERERGITIFSKQARLSTKNRRVTLVDTPGHVDFSPEAERTLGVLDCAVLVISGTDGVQAHTVTLWQLLERYQVPVFLFVSKMDLPGPGKAALLAQLQSRLSPNCLDPEDPAFLENAALCDEALLENYLHTGQITDANLRGLVAARRLFPCCFGSGLKLEGVAQLLDLLDRYALPRPVGEAFAARVYKISRDPAGTRLTWMKVTGGSLRVREPLAYVDPQGTSREEKPLQLRLYSGEKFTPVETVEAGDLCAVTGLTATWAGQGLGAEAAGAAPVLEPVMTYRVDLPKGVDPTTALPKLRQLEEEEPQLHVLAQGDQLRLQLMGQVQREVLCRRLRERFGWEVSLSAGQVAYKETIRGPVEGVGHFEPLRHYAEVHLLLEPLPLGSGLEFATACPTDLLDVNWQRLILTHLEEKVHRGVLVGAPITDMKLTLLAGRAHLKHTEGGDFRQATYRAVRQGLMQAESVLLEPWYSITLTLPTEQVGRAITDIRSMGGSFAPPEAAGGESILRGRVPAAALGDYPDQLAAYTQGRGRLQLALGGYAPCHNAPAVIAQAAYDPEADLDNSPDSVFCAHGAGFTVKWNQVRDYMHLDSGLPGRGPELIPKNLPPVDDRELEAIFTREFGPEKRTLYRPPEPRDPGDRLEIHPPREQYLLVDGYNVIFAWEPLAEMAKTDLEAARRRLLDWLSSYAGYRKLRVTVVFDGYKVKGNPGEKTRVNNLQVVYTRENETADAYLEALVAQIGKNYAVRVATSDSLVQLSSLRSGVLRMSARELWEEVEAARAEMKKHFQA